MEQFLDNSEDLKNTPVGDVIQAVLEQSKQSTSLAAKITHTVEVVDPKVYAPVAGVAILAVLAMAIRYKYKARKEEIQVSDDFEALI